MNLALLPRAPVWVLDDPNSPAGGQASAIAGRLGLPFRRLNATPGQTHRPGGPGPGLVLSAGAASGLRALLLQSRHGCRVVHCATRAWPPALLPARLLQASLPFDLTIIPQAAAALSQARSRRVIPVLGTPHVVSPGLLARARDLWAERLSHLPHPRILLLFGGHDPNDALAFARHLAALAMARGGCVMACVLPSGARAADALAAGLADCLHLIYRAGEPGDDPTLGFLGHADIIIAARAGARALSEACASASPVFVARAGSEGRQDRALIDIMRMAGQVRMFGDGLEPWARLPLDEAGRVALEIRARFGQA